ncbi:MAG: DUF3288 family protein [Acaryochloridaceae cyanobacterium SU_2_1]|nr:DUF3288 family protein [Acaryochloridaceae cyanobacterium SU_2_1]
MTSSSPLQPGQKDQLHPQRDRDRQTLDRLLREDNNELNLAELARLRIRYKGFPGSWDLQKDLDQLLKKWQLTEEQLFEQTRNIHATKQIYTVRSNKREDWT